MSTRIVVEEDDPIDDTEAPPFEYRDVLIRKDKWVKDEFEIQDFLGRGKFGEVKKCTEKSSGKEYAAKFICAPRPQDKKDVEHEVNIMKKLQHKRLIQLYDAFESKSEMCLVLEIIYGGELFDRVISEDFILTERACVAFVRQICEGLEYMHGVKIIHLDMKPENILCLTRTGNRIKIIDFGLAREYHPRKDLRVLFGTPEFMAPEVVQYEPINFGTDMWSVGVICYVLLSGLSPFMGDTDADTLTNVIKCQFDYNYAEFEEVSEEAKDLISRLLVKEKNKRLTATDCLNHPWLKNVEPSTQKPQQDSPSAALQLTKRRLKRFVYRRKWQKIVNAIIALRRMGFQLMSIKRTSLGNIASSEDIYGRDLTNADSDKPNDLDIEADDIKRALDVKNYDLNKRKPSDSGYESVAVADRDPDVITDAEASPSVTDASFDLKLETASSSGATSGVKSELVMEASLTLPPLNADVASTENKKGTKSKSSSSSARKSPFGESTSGKKSVIEKFGGLFLNNKEKDSTLNKKDKSPKKGTAKKNKDKLPNSLVKKDSTKRKVAQKPKQEVYVTTPGVKKKELFFGKGFDANGADTSSTGVGPEPSTSSNFVKSKTPKSTKNGTSGNDANSNSGDETSDHGSIRGNGVSSNDTEENNTPSLLLGNVKNKRKLFESNARAS